MATRPTITGTDAFATLLREALAENAFLGLTLTRPCRSGLPIRQSVRPVELNTGPHLQWTLQHESQQTHENLTADHSVERTQVLLSGSYRNAHLFTRDVDVSARVRRTGECVIRRAAPSRRPADVTTSHDRRKQYLIPEGTPVPFLERLGVMTAEGNVRKARQDKFRQINRFLEFVDDIYPHLPESGRIEVADFGCGLSYLTFALHYYLTSLRGRQVAIRGIDRNHHVIQRCRETAEDLQLQGIDFLCGDIAFLDSDDTAAEVPLHLAVSLHACDTATDDALAAAVAGRAAVILAAPCCQHELFKQLDAPALALLTQHGVLKERVAALATDALRAAVLEQSGYRTQVIEFIETEHTPKNLLLRAVRRPSGSATAHVASQITELKTLLGLRQTRLETLLDSINPPLPGNH